MNERVNIKEKIGNCDRFHRYENFNFRLEKLNYGGVVEGAILIRAVLKGHTQCPID